jgi:hypothetical protein
MRGPFGLDAVWPKTIVGHAAVFGGVLSRPARLDVLLPSLPAFSFPMPFPTPTACVAAANLVGSTGFLLRGQRHIIRTFVERLTGCRLQLICPALGLGRARDGPEESDVPPNVLVKQPPDGRG